jgi:hypothetical protein
VPDFAVRSGTPGGEAKVGATPIRSRSAARSVRTAGRPAASALAAAGDPGGDPPCHARRHTVRDEVSARSRLILLVFFEPTGRLWMSSWRRGWDSNPR